MVGTQSMGNSISEWPGVGSARLGHSVPSHTHSSHRLLSNSHQRRSSGSRCQDQHCVCENIHLVTTEVVCACVPVYLSCVAHTYMCKDTASCMNTHELALPKLFQPWRFGRRVLEEWGAIDFHAKYQRYKWSAIQSLHYHIVICSCVPGDLLKVMLKTQTHKSPVANARLVFKNTLKDI